MKLKSHLIQLLYLLEIITAEELEFPQWLRSLTGRSSWPSNNAPYIYEPYHNFSAIEPVNFRQFGVCKDDINDTAACSFDCHRCIAPGDIYTCSPMSQTFDDGPSYATSTLLDGLKKSHIRTTFFLIGLNVVQIPNVVRREHREGHIVAVHTWSHKYLPELSNKDVFAELQWCIWAINASAGVIPRYFRPPYGGIDNRIRDISHQLGLIPVLWDLDTNDWKLSEGTRSSRDVLTEVADWTSRRRTTKKSRWFQPNTQGLLLEHDVSKTNVELALKINSELLKKQKRVDQCTRAKIYLG